MKLAYSLSPKNEKIDFISRRKKMSAYFSTEKDVYFSTEKYECLFLDWKNILNTRINYYVCVGSDHATDTEGRITHLNINEYRNS